MTDIGTFPEVTTNYEDEHKGNGHQDGIPIPRVIGRSMQGMGEMVVPGLVTDDRGFQHPEILMDCSYLLISPSDIVERGEGEGQGVPGPDGLNRVWSNPDIIV